MLITYLLCFDISLNAFRLLPLNALYRFVRNLRYTQDFRIKPVGDHLYLTKLSYV